MNRITETFKRLRSQGKKAFIPYVMAGDPSLDKTRETVILLERCGADMVELGVPFTDPLADGPTIQRASERALLSGVTLGKVIGLVNDLRYDCHLPILLMTYYNPVFRYGVEEFARDAAGAGVAGVIIPDLPPEEAGELLIHADPESLAAIFLAAPTSTDERIKRIARTVTGFIYYVSITGITGAKLSLDSSLRESLNTIRSITKKPIAVGFGVSTPEEAKTVSEYADGVIIGSAIVKRLHEAPDSLEEFVKELRGSIK